MRHKADFLQSNFRRIFFSLWTLPVPFLVTKLSKTNPHVKIISNKIKFKISLFQIENSQKVFLFKLEKVFFFFFWLSVTYIALEVVLLYYVFHLLYWLQNMHTSHLTLFPIVSYVAFLNFRLSFSCPVKRKKQILIYREYIWNWLLLSSKIAPLWLYFLMKNLINSVGIIKERTDYNYAYVITILSHCSNTQDNVESILIIYAYFGS